MKKIIIILLTISFMYSTDIQTVKIFQDYIIEKHEKKEKQKKIALTIAGVFLNGFVWSMVGLNIKNSKRF